MKYGRLVNKRVGTYQRFSSDQQSESSNTDQLYRNRQFVEREGGDPSKIITIDDDAISGSKFHRPGLEQLLRLVDERKLDAVVVEDMSWFAPSAARVRMARSSGFSRRSKSL